MATREQTQTGAVTLRSQRKGSVLAGWLSSTDHKVIGHMYLITSFFFFCCAGIMALLIRVQLLGPKKNFVSDQQYNELFTMHGAIMLLLFATPLFVGFSNELLPLQIGSPDVAFPRLNLLSYYMFAFGGLILLFSFLAPGGSAAFGWYAYAPLTSATYSPGIGADLWIMGLVLSGLGTILGAVNFITTIFCLRAPGMTMFRMPIFTWNALLTSIMVLLAFPVLAAALLVLEVDRRLGAQVFAANSGGAILWQNLFWFFGHPEVYILALPFFGIATEIIPVFSHKPMFAYKGMIAATIGIAGLSMTVWAHHMFTTGAVLLPFFSFMSLLIAIPTGIKFFNWAGTMWHGQLTFEPPMLYSIGFLVTFLFGGITGVILASPPMNFAVSDSYFVVAHFHYVLAGTVMFAMFAGFYFWWPKFTGKMLNSRLGKVQFWLLFIGFHMTFLVQHWVGRAGPGAAHRELPAAARRRHHTEHHLHGRLVDPRTVRPAVPLERLHHHQVRREGHGRGPVGLLQLAGMGHFLPAAAAQLLPDSQDPVRAPGVRGALPAHQDRERIPRHRPDHPGGQRRAAQAGVIPLLRARKLRPVCHDRRPAVTQIRTVRAYLRESAAPSSQQRISPLSGLRRFRNRVPLTPWCRPAPHGARCSAGEASSAGRASARSCSPAPQAQVR